MIEHDQSSEVRDTVQSTLSEKTYRELRRRVLEGELEAGSQLVNRTLAQTLDVSLAPVRDAIRRLATEGLVNYIPGAGAFVRKSNLADLEELYVVREAIEGCAAAEAARNATEAQIAQLDELCREFESILAVIGNEADQLATDELLDQWLDCERRFHVVVVDAARNRLIAKVISDNSALARVFGVQRHRAAILTFSVADETCRDHVAITDAIRSRDADLAQRLMSSHIRKGRQTVLNYLRSQKRNDA